MYRRPSIETFANVMERRLRFNDDKKGEEGWEAENTEYLMSRLRNEVEELENALARRDPSLVSEAADVANFAMMVAEVGWASAYGGPMFEDEQDEDDA